MANGFLVLKIGAVLSIVFTGFTLLLRGLAPVASEPGFAWLDSTGDSEGSGVWFWVGEIVTALFGTLFAYGGWEAVSDNHRNLVILQQTQQLTSSDWLCCWRYDESSP